MVKFKLTDDISPLSNTFELKIRILEPFLVEKEDEGDRQVFEAPVQEIVYKANKLKDEKKRQVIRAKIRSISELGEVQVKFSQELFDQFKNLTEIVNHTNTLIEIRRQGVLMNDFTWKAVSLKK